MPSQCFTGPLLEAAQIDITFDEDLARLDSEVRADGRDHAYRREKTRSNRKVRRRSAENIRNAAIVGLDRVVGNRADHHEIHIVQLAVPLERRYDRRSSLMPRRHSNRSRALKESRRVEFSDLLSAFRF